ncbi:MAG: ATP-binding protein [Verrucomicrobiia bacterium]
MARLIESVKRRSRWFFGATALAVVLVIGTADYLTGVEISFSVFYLLAVALAVWFVGRFFGVVISILSVAVWLMGDIAAGAHYSSPLVPIWNAAVLTAFYFIVVWLLDRLRLLQKDLESRVQQRTLALAQEMTERERLEKEILNIVEREQQRIGHDLHDSLGQHLTAAAFAGKVLSDQLADQPVPAAAARQVVTLVEDGIALTRTLARGLTPVELTADGLMEAFEELSDSTSERFRVECRFECDVPVLIPEAGTATHLYRIAQEAIHNAIKHGQAKRIIVQLARTEAGTVLEIVDDGTGLPDPLPAQRGMGLRIMAHRATMIGGTLTVRRGSAGGTVVTCTMP